MAEDADSSVLFVAEKPSVARALAELLSCGRHGSHGARPLETHYFFAYFAPARRRCSIAVTSV
eukprot:2168476-Prymnesium_polylepis.1